MQLRRRPQPPLDRFIDILWYIEAAPQAHSRERLLPTGTVELVIPLEETRSRFYDPQNPDCFDEHPGPLLLGAQSGYLVINAETHAVLGAHFHPGGAFPFLGVPASEVENQVLSLENLWGREAAWLRERILTARTPAEKLDVLERALRARAQTLERNPAVTFALHQLNGFCRVSDVVGKLGVSSRRFIQLFHTEVGLTPKCYSRVRRFQDVIAAIESTRNLTWTDLALHCGYYDQAHFNHDFRTFSGINPERYLAGRQADRLNHVPV